MNFSKAKVYDRPRLIQDGDLVVIYERHDSLNHIYLSKGQIFNNKYGSFHHNDIIGKHFGIKVYSRCSTGWLYVLEPNTELWSNAVHVSNFIMQYCIVFMFSW
jgi:tRNA (adenine57-N1/adenine58-N1)-methyltransferase